jgi:hypothetical protein
MTECADPTTWANVASQFIWAFVLVLFVLFFGAFYND